MASTVVVKNITPEQQRNPNIIKFKTLTVGYRENQRRRLSNIGHDAFGLFRIYRTRVVLFVSVPFCLYGYRSRKMRSREMGLWWKREFGITNPVYFNLSTRNSFRADCHRMIVFPDSRLLPFSRYRFPLLFSLNSSVYSSYSWTL